jgi:hypothetical protein
MEPQQRDRRLDGRVDAINAQRRMLRQRLIPLCHRLYAIIAFEIHVAKASQNPSVRQVAGLCLDRNAHILMAMVCDSNSRT